MKRPTAFWTLLAVVALLAFVRVGVRSASGLRADYAEVPPRADHAVSRIDAEISTDAIASAWSGAPPSRFRATWTGYLAVPRAGWYTFATTSDDGSAVAIDGERVVDNGGEHGPQTRTGRIRLPSGLRRVLVEFTQAGGGFEMAWSWAREDGSLSAIPSWALWTRRTSAWRPIAARVLDPILFMTVLAAAVAGLRRLPLTRVRAVPTLARPWAKRALLLFLSLAFALGAAEAAARVVFRSVRSSGDVRTVFATRAEPARANNLGFRGPDVAAKGDRYRIIVIGDSITWGVGLAESERYTNLLERSLGSGYEVVNFGIPGHNMPEHLRELEQALPVEPDFILLQLYTNDFEVGNMVRPRARPLLPWPSLDRWFLRSSIVYTMLSAQWPGIQEKVGLSESYEHYMSRYLGDPHSAEAREGFGMLHTFVERARAAGVPMGAVMFPNPYRLDREYPFTYLHDRVKGICADERIHCVDLRAPFVSKFSSVSEIVVSPFDGHPSAAASRVAAAEILAEFKPLWSR